MYIYIILVLNYHGCKGEGINLIPHNLIDIIHKTEAIKFRKVINYTKYKLIYFPGHLDIF